MTHRLATNYAKNYCNRTPIVKVIVENVVTCFFGTRCIIITLTGSETQTGRILIKNMDKNCLIVVRSLNFSEHCMVVGICSAKF